MTILLSEVDRTSTVSVPLSEEVVLELEENPSTGYRWTIETTGESVEQLASTFTPSPSAGIGGGGRRVVRFLASRPGTTTIRAALRRTWEQSDRMIKQYAVTITVEGADDE
ncbi:MAG TPA: protease inhibitor I42 family protein [Thermoanaerobaculia bacterium]|nr:protease inhibitor I42 family protein [Thermoanaerobaculia bacterium]